MVDWAGAASGAVGGATVGGGVGGPWGALAGSVVGGAAGLFGSNKRKRKKISGLDKNQKKLNKDQHAAVYGEGPLADLYNYDPDQANSVFDQTVANPAYRNYKEKLLPETTGAFRSQGLQNSSYVGDAVTKMARDIQESLDAQRSKYLYGEQKEAKAAKQNAINNLQSQSTFSYDTSPGSTTIDDILKNVTPDQIKELKNWIDQYKGGA